MLGMKGLYIISPTFHLDGNSIVIDSTHIPKSGSHSNTPDKLNTHIILIQKLIGSIIHTLGHLPSFFFSFFDTQKSPIHTSQARGQNWDLLPNPRILGKHKTLANS